MILTELGRCLAQHAMMHHTTILTAPTGGVLPGVHRRLALQTAKSKLA